MSTSPKAIKIDGEIYDIPSKQTAVTTEVLIGMWKQLGKPKDISTASGKKLMEIVISAWEDNYPVEANKWMLDRKDDLANERSMKEHVKNHGRMIAAYPENLYKMMKAIFPKMRFGDKKTVYQLVREYPVFRVTNKV